MNHCLILLMLCPPVKLCTGNNLHVTMLFIRLIYSLIIRTLLFVTFMYPHGFFEINFLFLFL